MAHPDLVALLLVAHVVLGGIATVLVSANRKPSAAIAWVLTIIFVPFLGLVAFLLVGLSKLPEGRREKQRLVNEMMEERTQGLETLSHGEEWPAWLASMVALNRNLGALPMVGGNELTLIDDYRGAIKAMSAEVDRAEQYVHVRILHPGGRHHRPLLRRLGQAALTGRASGRRHRQGAVRPRRRHPVPAAKERRARLRRMGAQYYPIMPLRVRWRWQRPDLLNHRKLLVVDGRVGFGSQIQSQRTLRSLTTAF